MKAEILGKEVEGTPEEIFDILRRENNRKNMVADAERKSPYAVLGSPKGSKNKNRRPPMSAEARRKISQAQKRRWKKYKVRH